MKTYHHFSARSPLPARTNARVLVAASLLIAALGASGCAGDADRLTSTSGDPGAPSAQAPETREGAVELRMTGVALTPKQVEALKEAHAEATYLSTEEAKQVIESVGEPVRLSSPQSSGSDSSTGECSYIDLWGDSDGNYRFNQAVFPNVGEAATGDITISTDGWFAASAYHDLTLAGDYQHFEGSLPWTGVDAEATTMDGWMVTTGGNFCTGELDAVWE